MSVFNNPLNRGATGTLISNNFNENLKLNGVFSDSVISGNALGGKITDDFEKVFVSKITNVKGLESLAGIITLEKALKNGKTSLMEQCLFATMLPNKLPTLMQVR